MKKQLLFLVIFLITIISSRSAFSQGCSDSPISPLVGMPYTYSVDVGATPNPAGLYDGDGQYWFYITQDPNVFATLTTDPKIIDPTNAATAYFTVETGNYNDQTFGTGSIELIWTQLGFENYLATTPYYLVVRYTEQGEGQTCSANNMKVWEIKPMVTLLLAIDASTDTYCSADVSGAVVNTTTTPPTIQYTYGVNEVYAEVTATLYTGEWRPYFAIPNGLVAGDNQELTQVDWSYTADFSGTVYTTTANATFGDGFISDDLATTAADGSVIIYVRYTITNNDHENLSGQSLDLAVDGVIELTDPDINDIIGGDPADPNYCDEEAAYGKSTPITIIARPNVESGDPVNAPFVVKNP